MAREKHLQRAIIFDFDGTIADSLPAVIEVFEAVTGKPHGYNAEEIQELRHLSLLDLAAELGVSRWRVPYLLFRGRRLLRTYLSDIKAQRGVREVLASLQARGERLFIVSSNSTENVREYLEAHGLGGYFAHIYGGASLLGKARHLHKVIDRERIDTARSWYVGDETRDIIAAHAVGLRVVSVSWGYNSRQSLAAKAPDALVDTAAELSRVLEG
jgi:phosphoglycolate phosphatase